MLVLAPHDPLMRSFGLSRHGNHETRVRPLQVLQMDEDGFDDDIEDDFDVKPDKARNSGVGDGAGEGDGSGDGDRGEEKGGGGTPGAGGSRSFRNPRRGGRRRKRITSFRVRGRHE